MGHATARRAVTSPPAHTARYILARQGRTRHVLNRDCKARAPFSFRDDVAPPVQPDPALPPACGTTFPKETEALYHLQPSWLEAEPHGTRATPRPSKKRRERGWRWVRTKSCALPGLERAAAALGSQHCALFSDVGLPKARCTTRLWALLLVIASAPRSRPLTPYAAAAAPSGLGAAPAARPPFSINAPLARHGTAVASPVRVCMLRSVTSLCSGVV